VEYIELALVTIGDDDTRSAIDKPLRRRRRRRVSLSGDERQCRIKATRMRSARRMTFAERVKGEQSAEKEQSLNIPATNVLKTIHRDDSASTQFYLRNEKDVTRIAFSFAGA
jgi:hypothetical protein